MFTQNSIQHYLNHFDENKRAKMLAVYITSFENHLKICSDALQAKDAPALQSSLHDVKSLCYMIEANEVGRQAESIEAAFNAEDGESAYQDVPALLNGLSDILTIMNKAL